MMKPGTYFRLTHLPTGIVVQGWNDQAHSKTANFLFLKKLKKEIFSRIYFASRECATVEPYTFDKRSEIHYARCYNLCEGTARDENGNHDIDAMLDGMIEFYSGKNIKEP